MKAFCEGNHHPYTDSIQGPAMDIALARNGHPKTRPGHHRGKRGQTANSRQVYDDDDDDDNQSLGLTLHINNYEA